MESELTSSPLNRPLCLQPSSPQWSPCPIRTSLPSFMPLQALSFSGQPLHTLASKNLTIPLMAIQSHPLVSVAPQSNFQNLSLAPQTQPQPAQASQDQPLATPVSLIQFAQAQVFKGQPVDLRVIPAVQDFPALYENQQAPLEQCCSLRDCSQPVFTSLGVS